MLLMLVMLVILLFSHVVVDQTMSAVHMDAHRREVNKICYSMRESLNTIYTQNKVFSTINDLLIGDLCE